MSNQKRIFCSGFVGTFLALLGTAAIILIPALISFIAHSRMALLPGNPSYPLWRDLDLPIYQKFYFFNVTNAGDVERSGAAPRLDEIGPFVFRVNLTKSGLKWRDDRTKLTFRETKRYNFVRHLSIAGLDTNLITLHVPLAVAYDTLDFDSMNPFVRPVVKRLLASQSFFLQATIDELLFKGKKNTISCLAHVIDPKNNPDCYFAYLRGQNDTNDGVYVIDTGSRVIRAVNSIITLNGSAKLDFWDGAACNRIAGATNGELFPPLDSVNGSDKRLRFFRSDFCRVFDLTRNETAIASDVTDTLLVDRFRPDPAVFANETVNPANSCYKPNRNRTKEATEEGNDDHSVSLHSLIEFFRAEGVLVENAFDKFMHTLGFDQNISAKTAAHPFRERPSGVFDLSACQHGWPIFISWPHFMNADPIYRRPIVGLRPNASRHQTYVDIEPITGAPVDFLARVQINVDVNSSLSNSRLRSMMFPTMWQEFSIHITDRMAHTIISQTRTPRVVAFSISTLTVAVGVALILYAAFLIFADYHRRKRGGGGGGGAAGGNRSDKSPLLSDQIDVGSDDSGGSSSNGDSSTAPAEIHHEIDHEDSTNNNVPNY